jgi:hypothetical protein
MKMKTIKSLLLAFAGICFITSSAQAQESCDSLAGVCKKNLRVPPKDDKNAVYVSDGQTYRAFLDEEQTAEFQTTFYGGNTYRITATAGTKDNFVIFEVYDSQNNLIFSNIDHKNAPYWDFKVEGTLDVVVNMRLDANKKSSGCAVMLIGFKQKK